MKRVTLVSLIFFLGLMLIGCGDDECGSEGWGLPCFKETRVDPALGNYINENDSNEIYVAIGVYTYGEDQKQINLGFHFSTSFNNPVIDDKRYCSAIIEDGGFRDWWGQIGGTHCPTDGWAISGYFVSETRVEGIVKAGYACTVVKKAHFVSNLSKEE